MQSNTYNLVLLDTFDVLLGVSAGQIGFPGQLSVCKYCPYSLNCILKMCSQVLKIGTIYLMYSVAPI